MKKHRVKSPFLVSLIISVSVTTTLYLFSFTSLYKSVKYSANDFKIKQYAKIELADPDIALVAIDELSMNKFSKLYNYHWPWPRQFYGIILGPVNIHANQMMVHTKLSIDTKLRSSFS